MGRLMSTANFSPAVVQTGIADLARARTRLPKLRPADIDNHVHNMSPGPGVLPKAVMQKAQHEFLSWPAAPGQSVMSVSHREADGPYQSLASKVVNGLRDLLEVPSNYHVLLMHGGAHGQFSAVPLNLGGNGQPRSRAAGVDTGYWSRRAAAEHAKYVDVAWCGSASAAEPVSGEAGEARDELEAGWGTHTSLPDASTWRYRDTDAFVHVCANETIHGIELHADPALRPTAPPLVGDFTSTLLSRPVDVAKYGVLYASGGKNLGPAGMTVALVRDDLIADASRRHPLCPSMLAYSSLATSTPQPNLYLTPPTFNVYMTGLVLDHLKSTGGVAAAARRAEARAQKVYDAIDASRGFYQNDVDVGSRSRMSIPFRVSAGGARPEEEMRRLERAFVAESEAAGFRNLQGHPALGGLRATLYLGLPDASVDALVVFMRRFERKHA